MSQEEEGSGGGGGHDAGGMMRWLLTYADMITLLMAFFIMMYSMSVLNREKFAKAAAGLRAQFGPQKWHLSSGAGADMGKASSHAIVDQPKVADHQVTLDSVQQQLEDYIKVNDLETAVTIQQETRGLVISIVSDDLLFDKGRAELRPQALALLDQIAGLLQQISNPVAVEGHTCDIPIHTEKFPSNWELSAARACSVVRYLIDRHEISPRRLSASGFADTRPVAPNTDPEGRARNRRVDLVILANPEGEGDETTTEEGTP